MSWKRGPDRESKVVLDVQRNRGLAYRGFHRPCHLSGACSVGNPTRRTKSLNRGSERRLSQQGSTLSAEYAVYRVSSLLVSENTHHFHPLLRGLRVHAGRLVVIRQIPVRPKTECMAPYIVPIEFDRPVVLSPAVEGIRIEIVPRIEILSSEKLPHSLVKASHHVQKLRVSGMSFGVVRIQPNRTLVFLTGF